MAGWRRFSFAVLFLLACQPSSVARNATTASSRRSPETAVRMNGLIRLDITVNNHGGYPIGLLQRGDFTVLDNDAPQKIVAFQPSTDEEAFYDSPVSVVILLDKLNVPAEMAAFERAQTTNFLRLNHGSLLQPVTLYSLDKRGLTRFAGPSRDGNLLADAVASDARTAVPEVPRELLHGSLEKAWEQYAPLKAVQAIGMIATDLSHLKGRKLLLWVGSGLNDWGSGAYLDETYYYRKSPGPNIAISDPALQLHLFDKITWFSKLLREARVSIDTISLGETKWAATQPHWDIEKEAWTRFTEGPPRPAEASLMHLYKKVLAVASGGQVIPDYEDLAKQMDQCVRRLAAFYTLTIEPPLAKDSDEYHSLAVTVTRPGLTAYTSKGYYDEPYYEDATGAGARQISVAELQQMLQADPKRETAEALPDLVLAERLDNAQRSTLRAQVRRGEARDQFEALADESQFQAPAPDQAASWPAPSSAEQQQMLSAADRFLAQNTARLPNFTATRSTVTLNEIAGLHEFETAIRAQPFRIEQKFDATVSYRHGSEVITLAKDVHFPNTQSLYTTGTFGPLLHFTLQNAMSLRDGVRWIRWEQGPDGRRAVFGFTVPADHAGPFGVSGCCLPEASGNDRWGIVPGYHGEVTVSAASGAIWRVQVEADLNQFVPVKHSALVVTYGPVVIGGETYVLPLHGISLWRGREVVVLVQGDLSFSSWGPYETRINEFTFDLYRMFRGQARLLPGYTRVPAGSQ